MYNLIMTKIDFILNTSPLPGIGEYKQGKHWKDQSTAKKCADVFKASLKFIVPALFVGAIAFLATPPPLAFILAPVLATALALAGLGLIAKSVYELEHIDQTVAPSVLINDAPGLGEWTENKVMVTENGSESMDLKLELIEKANHSIEISGSYCGGAIFDKVLDRIEKKLENNPNLKVRILSSQPLLTKSNRERIRHLAGLFPDQFFVVETAMKKMFVPTFRTIENHVKFLVVDGKACMTGGTGIQDMLSREGTDDPTTFSKTDKIMGKGARDMDVVVEGPLAKTMQQEFYRLLAKWQRLMPPSKQYRQLTMAPDSPQEQDSGSLFNDRQDRVVSAPSTMLTGSYEHGSEHGCKLGYLRLIDEAREKLVIANMSLNQPEILTKIKEARARGVEVIVITNANQKDAPLSAKTIGLVNKYYFAELLKTGVQIYEYKQASTLYHKKAIVVDGRYTAIGSFNISLHCADTEDEDLVVVDSAEIAEHTMKTLEEDMNRSHKASREEYSGFFGSMIRSLSKSLILKATAHVYQ